MEAPLHFDCAPIRCADTAVWLARAPFHFPIHRCRQNDRPGSGCTLLDIRVRLQQPGNSRLFPADQFQASQFWHLVVGNQEVEMARAEDLPTRGTVSSDRHLVAGPDQYLGVELADVQVILDDEDAPRRTGEAMP